MTFSPKKCCICGPVRNCAPFLDAVFANIEKIGGLFDDYRIVVFYDASTDQTMKKLIAYREKNPRLTILVNTSKTLSRFRTHRIAYARNKCLEKVREFGVEEYPFFIMMDMDNVNVRPVRTDVLEKYIRREEEWDALSFNTAPIYYDVWAVSIKPFCFSYNHFHRQRYFHGVLEKYMDNLLKQCKAMDRLLPCYSSFNGFSIYKTRVFLGCQYDGKIRLDLIPPSLVEMHKKAARSHIVFKDYGNVDGRHEDCEHRSFHYEALKKGARIRISPDVLF
jgi:glycosyltransferase involved in cell wall biosynthesis